MSTNAAPPAPKGAPGPIAPPEEQFWEKYSPHYEFPLSSVGSLFLHVGGLVVFLLALWLLSKLTTSDSTALPIRVMSVSGDADGPGKEGGEGGSPTENVENPLPMARNIPDADLDKVKEEFKDIVPKIPQQEDSPQLADLKNLEALAKLSEDIRNQLAKGSGGQKGSGENNGKGTSPEKGTGSGGKGDASSSANRSVRWVLEFRTQSGKDYLEQLAAMKATLVITHPDGTHKAYTNLNAPKTIPFKREELPDLFFVDDSADSASKIARELGLDFSPKSFIAFFPKDIEEELARKERIFRDRKESEIFETTFKILIRDGQPSITVTDQKTVRR